MVFKYPGTVHVLQDKYAYPAQVSGHSSWVGVYLKCWQSRTNWFCAAQFSWLTVVCPSKQMGSFALLLVVTCGGWAIHFADAKRDS